MTIADQIQSIKTRPDQKTFWTAKQEAEAKAELISKSDIDISILGRKAKSIYPKLLVLLLKLQRRGYCEYKPFSICQTSKAWLQMDKYVAKKLGLNYGDASETITFSYTNSSRHNVSQTWNMADIYANGIAYQQELGRLLNMVKLLGIISEVKCGYSFISASSIINAKGHSKYYVMNKDKSSYFISYILSILSISTLLNTNSNSHTNTYTYLPIANTFDATTKYWKIMEERNEKLPDMEKCIFDGQRAWSQLCNMKKDGERQEYLTRRFGGEYEEWDRTACIPNLIYTLNTGLYNDNSLDLHEKLYGQPFISKEDREDFKTLNMLKWFGDARSIRGIIHNAKNITLYNRGKTIKKSHKKVLNALVKITNACRHNDWGQFEAEALAYYKDMRQRAEDYLGDIKRWKSKIFWHESNVHIMFIQELTNLGYDVAQIYDGFYFKKGCKPSDFELNNLYRKCVLEYRSTLIGEN